ncbi:MAG: MFS family permease [Verrucomicrobiales bacterium]|jgi:MFS family permease
MLSSRRAGLIAAVVLASSCEFFFLARTLTPDMMMCFWITASIAALLRHHHYYQRESIWSWLFFVCAGVGFLTKGPVAFIVPGFAAIGLWWSRKQAIIPLRGVPWIRGIFVAITIGLSWFVVAAWHHPELYEYFIYDEFLHRIGSSSHGRSQPFWFFMPVAIAGFFPWTLLIRYLITESLSWKNGQQGEEASQNGTFLIWWVVPAFLVLSISGSKLLTYILPLFPPVAVVTGMLLHNRISTRGAPLRVFYGIAAVVTSIGVILVFVSPLVPFQSLEPLVPGEAKLAVSCAIIIATFFASVFAIFAIVRIRRQVSMVVVTGTLACLSWLCVATQAPRLNLLLAQQATVKPIATSLMNHPDFERSRIIASNVRAHGFEFYLGREVEMTTGQASLAMEPSAHARERLHRSSKTVARIESCTPLFVLTRTGDADNHFHNWEKLTQAGDFVLLHRESQCPPKCLTCGEGQRADSEAGTRSDQQ